MRMAELSAATGVAVPTIKYYQRERMLHSGERTGPNQMSYDDSHVRRLNMIRALLEHGGLQIADIRQITAAMDGASDPFTLLGIAQDAIVGEVPRRDPALEDWAWERLEQLAARHGWPAKRGGLSSRRIMDVMIAMRLSGHEWQLDLLGNTYADAAATVAEADIDSVLGSDSIDRLVEDAVVGTVIGGALLLALRHLAHEASAASSPVGPPRPRSSAKSYE